MSKIKKSIARFLPFLLVFPVLFTQAQEYQLITSVGVKAKTFTTDRLGNSYVITNDNELLKFDPRGLPLVRFSDKNSGELKLADVTNPLKILLFYPQFAQVTSLDNKLSFRTQTDLRQLGLLQPIVICSSVNEGMWIYDQQDYQLKRLNLDQKVVQESGNLNQVAGILPKPTAVIEQNNNVYLINPETGILVFDIFGTYYKTIPVKNALSVQLLENSILYLKEGHLFRYDLKTIQETEVSPFPLDTDIIAVRIENNRLYVLKKGSLNIYGF